MTGIGPEPSGRRPLSGSVRDPRSVQILFRTICDLNCAARARTSGRNGRFFSENIPVYRSTHFEHGQGSSGEDPSGGRSPSFGRATGPKVPGHLSVVAQARAPSVRSARTERRPHEITRRFCMCHNRPDERLKRCADRRRECRSGIRGSMKSPNVPGKADSWNGRGAVVATPARKGFVSIL